MILLPVIKGCPDTDLTWEVFAKPLFDELVKLEKSSVTDGFVKRSRGKASKSRGKINKRGQI